MLTADDIKLMSKMKPDDAAAYANAKLKAAAGPITYKVSVKGALSVYGLGRRPITAYDSQWERLDEPEEVERRRAFRLANRTVKADVLAQAKDDKGNLLKNPDGSPLMVPVKAYLVSKAG